ncbi:SDR family NAD(P)-dependent oxidoreductase [Celeribacter sp.]|uniref:SDR family NAD(P)-dependent oxidoreductase n=1 Tax=Celeribacter sp. TaxID=1890673 RepID=UPI003A936A26
MFDLTGKRALVTGSSRGIGAEIAIGLATQGADVCIHFAGSRESAEQTAAQVRRLGRSAGTVKGDISDPEAPASIVKNAEQSLGGPINLLVINAAIQTPQEFLEIDQQTARHQFDANLYGTLGLIQTVLPQMKAAQAGRIVTIGSVQQWRPHPQMLVYAALKSGMENLVRNLAVQLGPYGITINNVAPGAIATDRNNAALSDDAYRAKVEGNIPLGRIGTPQECAGVVAMLCSEAGDYITGADIPVDGGMRLG